MACPHVSGIAALIMSIHPDWSPAAIRSALMTTAYPAYKNGKTLLDGFNKKPATDFGFGAEHVDPVSCTMGHSSYPACHEVADFGLVKNAPDGKYSVETRLAGAFGYLAPEH
ncbi:hypothetical protein KIW84_035029 [Lathyrus oleraceus]|uniref:Peptidase S8/S53 domain-containing protein n=1 Tax=Pisum sativum TaxID=3888 RepID=A0A9D5B622_PEA|nr:hypothetical protein KIW84_035029 [Pisum sativum]